MKKTILLLISIVTLLITMFAMADVAFAGTTEVKSTDIAWTEGVEGGAIYFDAETGTITGCDARVTAVIIQDEIKGQEVSYIGKKAFKECTLLKDITISESVKGIGAFAFESCVVLNKVTVPDSVKSIGVAAFRYCSRLTKAVFPNGLTEIEESTFWACESLKEFKIPNSVVKIGNWSFTGCRSLDRIIIPDSVISIGDSAFWDCTSLTEMVIPSSVETMRTGVFKCCTSLKSVRLSSSIYEIGNSMFEGCIALEEIDIPTNVVEIGLYAFEDCKGLRKVSIPEGVKKIKDRAFQNCKTLIELCIPESVTSIGEFTFWGCDNLKYIIGEKGSYAEKYAGDRDYTFITAAEYLSSKVGKNKYGIFVYDSEGNPIPNARVTFGDKAAVLTGRDGLAAFDGLTIGTPVINVSKSGYETWTNANINYEKSRKGYETITLYRTDEAELRVVRAEYNDELNLCVSTKKLVLPYKSNDTKFTLRVETKTNSAATYYEIWQNSKMIAYSDESGLFKDLRATLFSEGKGVYIKAYDSNKKSYQTPINLIFVRREISNKTKKIKLGGGALGFTVDEDVPLMGGKEIELNALENLPLVIKYKDDTVYFTLNFFDSDENGSDLSNEQLAKLKRILNIPKGAYFDRANQDTIKNLFKEVGSQKLGGNLFVKVVGCGSMKLDEMLNASKINMNIYILAEAEGSVNGQTVVFAGPVPVPLTWEFALSGSVKAGATAMLDITTSQLEGSLTVFGNIKLSAFGGVGAGQLVGGGVYGDGKISAEYVILSTSAVCGLKSVVLGWDVGVKAYAYIWETEYPIIGDEYYLYTRTETPKNTMLPAMASPNVVAEQIYDASGYTIQDVSYLVNESDWLGQGSATYRLQSVRNGSESGVIEIKPLLTNTYENSQPTVVASKDNMVLAYLRADTSRNVCNMTQIMYSVYDENTDTWREPKALNSEDMTSDYAPQLFSDGKDIFLVYQDSSKVFDEESSALSEFAKAQNIKVAIFDAETKTFTDITLLSPSDEDGVKYHSEPCLGLVNGVLTAAWIANNEAEDVFGQNASNEIWVAQYINGQWQPANKLIGEENCVADLKVTNEGIAYIRDEDNNLATDVDHSLLLLSIDAKVSEIASGKISNLKISELSGEKVLTWLSEDGLYKYADGVELLCADFGAVEYQITGDNIYFTASENGTSSNIYKAICDAQTKTYHSTAALTDSSAYVENVNVVDFKGRTYAMLVQSQVALSEESVDRKCDLSWCRLSEVTDLTLVAAEYEQEKVEPDAALPVQFTLKNNGTTRIETVDIAIADESGAVVYSENQTVSMNSGDECVVEAQLTMPETIKKTNYTVTITTGNADRNFADNETTFTVGYTDLSVSYEQAQIGDKKFLYMTVTNESYVAGSGRLEVKCGEEVTFETEIEALEKGESTTIAVGLSDIMLSNGESGTITIEVTANEEEASLYNNQELVYLDMEYEVSYFANIKSNEEAFCEAVKSYDEPLAVQEISPARKGYRLIGWATDKKATEPEYRIGDSITENQALTLYGVWEENTGKTGILYGDVDENFKIDATDVLWIERHIAGWTPYANINQETADLNTDGTIDLKDVTILERYLAKWEEYNVLPLVS